MSKMPIQEREALRIHFVGCFLDSSIACKPRVRSPRERHAIASIVPFTSFSGVNFADVDYINVTLDATGVSGVDYDLIGGVRTVCNY